MVVHESNLPKGRGYSPLIKQLLNGKTKIVTTLFECSKDIDQGQIYIKKTFNKINNTMSELNFFLSF